MKGESLYKISALMGKSTEICRRHYAALIPETMSSSVEFDVLGGNNRILGLQKQLPKIYYQQASGQCKRPIYCG